MKQLTLLGFLGAAFVCSSEPAFAQVVRSNHLPQGSTLRANYMNAWQLQQHQRVAQLHSMQVQAKRLQEAQKKLPATVCANAVAAKNAVWNDGKQFTCPTHLAGQSSMYFLIAKNKAYYDAVARRAPVVGTPALVSQIAPKSGSIIANPVTVAKVGIGAGSVAKGPALAQNVGLSPAFPAVAKNAANNALAGGGPIVNTTTPLTQAVPRSGSVVVNPATVAKVNATANSIAKAPTLPSPAGATPKAPSGSSSGSSSGYSSRTIYYFR